MVDVGYNVWGELPRDARQQTIEIRRADLNCGLGYQTHGTGSIAVTEGFATVQAAGDITFVALAALATGDYFSLINADNNARAYYWFDLTGSDTVPAAVTSGVAAGAVGSVAVKIDVSGATSATDVAQASKAVINAVVGTPVTAAGAAEVLTITANESNALGAYGNNWDLAEAVTDAGFLVTNLTGGVGPDTYQPTLDGNPLCDPVNWITSDDATATAIAAALNASQGGFFAYATTNTVTLVQLVPGEISGALDCDVTNTATVDVTDFTDDTDTVVPISCGTTAIPTKIMTLKFDRTQLTGLPEADRAKVVPLALVPNNVESFSKWCGASIKNVDEVAPVGEPVDAGSTEEIAWYNESVPLVILPDTEGVWNYRIAAL